MAEAKAEDFPALGFVPCPGDHAVAADVARTVRRTAKALVEVCQVLHGTELADFSPPFQHDNLEGLAVQREGDSLVLWMISDDNEQWWQQTLLLKFRLDL